MAVMRKETLLDGEDDSEAWRDDHENRVPLSELQRPPGQVMED